MYRLFLTLSLFFLVISCRVKKDISSQSQTWEKIASSDTEVKKYQRITEDWLRINQSVLRRDGLLTITFDSISSVIILPDYTIQAIGYNPRIESAKAELKQLNIRDSIRSEQIDSLQTTGSKKKEESGSYESFKKEVDKTPSLIPWIGAGLAIAIVVLAVLYFFLWRR